jgi:hypothetical protein
VFAYDYPVLGLFWTMMLIPWLGVLVDDAEFAAQKAKILA